MYNQSQARTIRNGKEQDTATRKDSACLQGNLLGTSLWMWGRAALEVARPLKVSGEATKVSVAEAEAVAVADGRFTPQTATRNEVRTPASSYGGFFLVRQVGEWVGSR
jgi:hypothetical protein